MSESIVDAYLEAALFCALNEDGEPFDRDGFEVSDFTEAARATAAADVAAFLAVPGIESVVARYDDKSIGHDLYYTANGHGAGFWDGDYEDDPADEDALCEAAKIVAERTVYGETDAEGNRTLELL